MSIFIVFFCKIIAMMLKMRTKINFLFIFLWIVSLSTLQASEVGLLSDGDIVAQAIKPFLLAGDIDDVYGYISALVRISDKVNIAKILDQSIEDLEKIRVSLLRYQRPEDDLYLFKSNRLRANGAPKYCLLCNRGDYTHLVAEDFPMTFYVDRI